MDDSFHYMSMINHMTVQKKLMEQLKDTGLTLGQPKVLDYLKDHDGVSQKEIAAGCLIEAGSLTSILNRMEEKNLIERKMLNGNRRTFHIFMTESGKKNQKLVEEAFKKIEKTALNGISEEEQKLFMEIFCRIYRNLADMKWADDKKLWNEEKIKKNGETKTIFNISGGIVCKLPGSQPDHKGKPRNIPYFINSLRIKS